jgi:M6 family metalloprotease-like protein
MRKTGICLMLTLLLCSILTAVPPVPQKHDGIEMQREFPSEIFQPNRTLRSPSNVPDSILVLRVQFTDRSFDLVPDYPDSLAHDYAYFDRLMFHLASYYNDVSHGNYQIIEADGTKHYTLWDEVFTLPHPIGYYGDEELTGLMLEDIVAASDAAIDFSQYDSFIIFHAGAGQEADLTGNNTNTLWTSFISRRSLQEELDPENDDFPGIATNDGMYIKEFVLCPETEWQPDNIPGETRVYGIYGVICHQFGHQVGLPTLFDNYSANGYSQGIGNFGLMGTGVWNADGFVPPLPCAWSRYYMGWDPNVITIEASQYDNELVFPLADDDTTPTIYKVMLSETEYFLVENRQQNPDGSIGTASGVPSFTFQLLPPDQQDYYPAGHPNAGEPKFNFMENTYYGCEWDFYLPGLGDSSTDGSGILIWHVDETVLFANFTPDFDLNAPNNDASHKGVDLEEADGTQHLDGPPVSMASYGSANDAYRAGNNTYFGKRINPETGATSLPTSESYYGGIRLAIRNMSASDSLMTFDVEYEWTLDSFYSGTSPYSASIVDFDEDGYNDVIYPIRDGKIFMWQFNQLAPNYPSTIDSIPHYYAYDESQNTFLFPCEDEDIDFSRLYVLNKDQEYYIQPFNDLVWAGPPVVNPDTDNTLRHLFLPFNHDSDQGCSIEVRKADYTQSTFIMHTNWQIATNLMLKDDVLSVIMRANEKYLLYQYDVQNLPEHEMFEMPDLPFSADLLSALQADINGDGADDYVVTTSDSLLYVFHQDAALFSGYPVEIPLAALSVPTIADVDGNGQLDILIGGENNFAIFNANGSSWSPHEAMSMPDTLGIASGVMAADLDGDGQCEIFGEMSRNRFGIWHSTSGNTWEMQRYYPVSFSERALSLPALASYQDDPAATENDYIFVSGDNGVVNRIELPSTFVQPVWNSAYGNLQRTASYTAATPANTLATEKTFIKNEVYFYPNPLSRIATGSVFGGAKREQVITLKLLTAVNTEVQVQVFDIAGNSVFTGTSLCDAYIPGAVFIDASALASGVYMATITAEGTTLTRKFAIEK